MPRKPQSKSVESVLGDLAARAGKAKALRDGIVAFELTGPGGGDFLLDCGASRARLSKGKPSRKPIIHVTGDASRIRAILEGKKDARKQFFAGGIRVRGNLPYLSEIAVELGILREPL